MHKQLINTLEELLVSSAERRKDKTFGQFVGGGQKCTYSTLLRKANELSCQMNRHGVNMEAKVAILSENMPHWAIAFFSAVAYGRVAVPILPASSPAEVENILEHSESEVLFVSKALLAKVSGQRLEVLKLVYSVEDFSLVRENAAKSGYVVPRFPRPETLATIIYTSGTSGKAKGVMLSHANLCHSIREAYHAQRANHRDRWLSILPMAHTYELALGMLYPIFVGATVYYLPGIPAPSLLLKAMREVRPTLILTVPLVAEKIYRSAMGKIEGSRSLSWMLHHMPSLLYAIAGSTLRRQTGGRIKFFGIGGAKMNPEVEQFYKRTRFNYAIGYGTTETAPLICNACVGKTAVGTVGVAAYGVEVKLDNVDSATGVGEIVVRGKNVMMGYYKDSERTATVLSRDGWYHTGDLAALDSQGRYCIKGRLGNMIVDPSGENIYPEEIEQVINNFPGVQESLVIERERRLVAFVHLGEESLKTSVATLAETIKDFVNRRVSRHSALSTVQIVTVPLQKTATLKIRRNIYK
jgi:long-chain acyl-CoA synthetase